ncbi:biotin--[acetyl-CoA-carboxylase] ligase [Sulfurimonas sp. SAG-AH-194-C21]|nr:biotin--[acetyl-CoA-carboxylase] ligase [Sulfurimonas sp. SAG-AH-194-C21]MDF1882786.1 biotin--[acetyl-CoA-carboxylase] ligase [Sulfurimonas sp. SAG-AH-194-C21]
MKTLYFDTLASTQVYLKEKLIDKNISLPLAVVCELQTAGVGSRDNSWTSQKGNLFLSFALSISSLPKDLKLESASIYFSYLLKETLEDLGSKVFLKWPNDLYINKKKVGGMITNIVNDNIVCGVGLNLIKSSNSFANLDLELDKNIILKNYFKIIEKKPSWKQVFSKYKINFYTNQNFSTHIKGIKVSLSEAVLEDDGSLNINGERIYSLR